MKNSFIKVRSDILYCTMAAAAKSPTMMKNVLGRALRETGAAMKESGRSEVRHLCVVNVTLHGSNSYRKKLYIFVFSRIFK